MPHPKSNAESFAPTFAFPDREEPGELLLTLEYPAAWQRPKNPLASAAAFTHRFLDRAGAGGGLAIWWRRRSGLVAGFASGMPTRPATAAPFSPAADGSGSRSTSCRKRPRSSFWGRPFQEPNFSRSRASCRSWIGASRICAASAPVRARNMSH